jgi:hypothetical protein
VFEKCSRMANAESMHNFLISEGLRVKNVYCFTVPIEESRNAEWIR